MLSFFYFFLFLSMKVTCIVCLSHLCNMGFSNGEDLDTTQHIQLQLIDESIEKVENRNWVAMDLHHNQYHHHHNHRLEVEVEVEDEFWPLEHPMEPLDEDRPVKCPMEEDSSVINEGGMQKKQYGESSWKKRTDIPARAAVAANRERPPRVVRKRQHMVTRCTGDHILTPLMRMPTLPILQLKTQNNLTIFQMLQQLDQFES